MNLAAFLVRIESAAARSLGHVQGGGGGEGAQRVSEDHLPVRSDHLTLITHMR